MQTVLKVCDLYEPTLFLHAMSFFFFLLGVTRKQLGLTFLGETKQDIASLVGDICLEIEGIDRNVCTISCPIERSVVR